jgi:hypothetical protein
MQLRWDGRHLAAGEQLIPCYSIQKVLNVDAPVCGTDYLFELIDYMLQADISLFTLSNQEND